MQPDGLHPLPPDLLSEPEALSGAIPDDDIATPPPSTNPPTMEPDQPTA